MFWLLSGMCALCWYVAAVGLGDTVCTSCLHVPFDTSHKDTQSNITGGLLSLQAALSLTPLLVPGAAVCVCSLFVVRRAGRLRKQ